MAETANSKACPAGQPGGEVIQGGGIHPSDVGSAPTSLENVVVSGGWWVSGW